MGNNALERAPRLNPRQELTAVQVTNLKDPQVRSELRLMESRFRDLNFPLTPRRIIALGKQIAVDFKLATNELPYAPTKIQCFEGIRRNHPEFEDFLISKDGERAIADLAMLNREWFRRSGESFFSENKAMLK
jgi:hypothetical protein